MIDDQPRRERTIGANSKPIEPARDSGLLNSVSLETLFENAIEPHILFDTNGVIVEINRSGCLYFGITHEECTQYTIFDFLIDEDSDLIKAILNRIPQTHQNYTDSGLLNTSVKQRDIDFLTCDMVYQVVDTIEGYVVYARFHDQQVVRYLSRLLQQKEIFYRGAERLANLGSWEYFPAEDRITWSDEVFNIFGLEPSSAAPSFEEYLGFVHANDLQHFLNVVQNAMQNGESYIVKHRLLRPDGSIRWVIGRGDVFLKENGDLEKIFGTVQDITEEEDVRLTMRKSEQRIRFHLDRSPLGYVEWNANFEIVEWNEAAEKIFGFSKEEALAGIAQIIPEEEEEDINEVVTNLLSDQGGTHSINSNLTKSGMRITAEWFNTTLKGQNGEVIGIGSIVQDITQRIEAKKQLESYAHDLEIARDEAESAARAKSEFLANMSHEIRTPMNGVIGMASLMLDTNLDEEQRDYVETIVHSGESLLSIINDILNLSKIEAGKIELEFFPFSIRETVENTFDLLAAKAAEKELELIYSIDSSVPDELIGDPTRIQQVLLNLMGNGIKFTEEGYVEVVLESEMVDPQTALLTFHVSDTGIGIAEEKRDRLFKAFSQVDASTNRKYGGTGLGLSISSQLAHLMGGGISLESEEGLGSTFSFYFEVKIGRSRVPSRYDLRSLNVLLVEPNLKMQEMIRGYLDDLNCNHTIVANKEELFGMLADDQEHDYDVILLENNLEGENSMYIVNELKTHEKELPTIVLLTSIIDRMENSDTCERIAKPVHVKNLYRTLKKVSILQK